MRLLVVDSLAALFRVELGEASQAIQRACLLREFGHRLKTMSEEHGAVVMCINQVCTSEEYEYDISSNIFSEGSVVVKAIIFSLVSSK